MSHASSAAAAVREVLRGVPDGHVEFLRLTAPAAELAQHYLAERVLGPGMLADAEHIAMASVARVDVLVSWNFRHVVNLHRIHGYHDVNRRLGYPALDIRSPREVLGDESCNREGLRCRAPDARRSDSDQRQDYLDVS